MPSVDLNRVSELFVRLNILGIEGTNDPKCLAKNHGCLEVLENIYLEEKSQKMSVCSAFGHQDSRRPIV